MAAWIYSVTHEEPDEMTQNATSKSELFVRLLAKIFLIMLFRKSVTVLSLFMLGNFSCFCCRLLTFFKKTLSENYFRNTIRVSISLNPDQDRHSVPNC